MTFSTLSLTEIRAAISGVTLKEVDDTEAAMRFARAAWSGIAEPGDLEAGALIAALGADVALTGLLEGWSVDRFTKTALDNGVTLGESSLTAGLERWTPRGSAAATRTALRQASRIGATLLTPADEEWPAGFADLGLLAPIALWVRGEIVHLMQ